MHPGPPRAALRLWLGCVCLALVQADSPSAPVNVTVRHLKANSAVVSWDVLEDEVVIGFAISQQKKDVRMLRFIQEVNTTTRSCALWDLEEDTEYIVHVQAISIQGQSPASEPVLFKTPREAEKMASKNKDEVTMKEMGRNQQLRTGEVLIIVVVLFMWAERSATAGTKKSQVLVSSPSSAASMTSSRTTNPTTTRKKPRVRQKPAHQSTKAGGFSVAREAVGLPAGQSPGCHQAFAGSSHQGLVCGAMHNFASV
uniref:Fibronectin type III domain containing 5 n=1 Tax=Bos taurus TaxID=9913 RepID=A0A3Q1MMB3_BOVIN